MCDLAIIILAVIVGLALDAAYCARKRRYTPMREHQASELLTPYRKEAKL